MTSAKPRGVDDQAVEERHHDAADDHEEEEVLEERDRAAAGQQVELESLPERFDDALRDRGEQHDEAPEDEGVQHAGERPAEQPALGDDVDEERTHARPSVIEATLRARRAAHLAEQLSPAQPACRPVTRRRARRARSGLRTAVTAADTSVPSTPADASAGTPRCPPARPRVAKSATNSRRSALSASPMGSCAPARIARLVAASASGARDASSSPQRCAAAGSSSGSTTSATSPIASARSASIGSPVSSSSVARARADQPGQPLRAAPSRDDAELDLRLTEARGARGEAYVAREGQLAATAERDAVDRGDHRETRRLEQQGEVGRLADRIGARAETRDVGTGGEELRSAPGDDQGAAGLVGFGIREPLGQAVDDVAVDGIRRRVVDGERDDRALALDADDVMENLTHELCLPRSDDGCVRHTANGRARADDRGCGRRVECRGWSFPRSATGSSPTPCAS